MIHAHGKGEPMKQDTNFHFGKIVNCNALDLRNNPSINSRVICTLFPGAEILIEDDSVSEKTDWIKICTASGVEGYVKDYYIDNK